MGRKQLMDLTITPEIFNMAKNSIKTGSKVASTAGKRLREAKNPKDKSNAASALTNAKEETKPKKK